MLQLEKFKAGQFINADNYKAFSPNKINQTYCWIDPELTGLLDTATQKIGSIDAWSEQIPNLDRFIIKAIHDQKSLEDQFNEQQVDAMVGLDKRPVGIGNDTSTNEYEIPLNAQVMVFFKSSNEVLKDKIVRQALAKATNRVEVLSGLGYPVVPVKGPLLASHIGFAPDICAVAE